MRPLAYGLILFGLVLLCAAARDEHRGVAEAGSPSRYGAVHMNIISKRIDPKNFRNLMEYEWGRGAVFLCGGLILLNFIRRMDRLDPFSPNFEGNSALDELNRTLTEEEERRKRSSE
jgi:hypothetical protein